MNNPVLGIIGGSGVENLLEEYIESPEQVEVETPFGLPSSAILIGKIGDKKIAFLNRHGMGHKFSPSTVPYAANIFAMKKIGVKTIIATAAVGSLREDIHPGQLVLVDQFIDKTFKRRTSFFDDIAAVHIEMAQPCCERLRKSILDCTNGNGVTVHNGGTYICMEGPQFSTKAESLMHRNWGGDLIGMTAMPEAKLAREAQVCYSLIAMPSDYDCWRPHLPGADKDSLLKEIIGNLKQCTDTLMKLLRQIIGNSHNLFLEDCPCRKSLEFALWTDKSAMNKNKMDELAVLFE